MAALYRGRALARLDGGRGVPPVDEVEKAVGDLAKSARLESPGSRRTPRTWPTAAGCCSASIGPTTPWPPRTPPWRSCRPPPRITSSSGAAALGRYDDLIDSCDVALADGPSSPICIGSAAWRGPAATTSPGHRRLHPGPGAAPRRPGRTPSRSGLVPPIRRLARAGARDFEAVLAATRTTPKATPAGPRLGSASAVSARPWPTPRRSLRRPSRRPGCSTSPRRPTPRRRSGPSPRSPGAAVPPRADSLAYEARAAELLHQALEQTPASRRSAFWRDLIARDASLRPLFNNPRILRRLQAANRPEPLSRRDGERPP